MVTPELALAAACCRRPSPERDAAVRAAAQSVDWTRFLLVLDCHRVDGLAHRALRAAGAPLPEAARAELAQRAASIARGNLTLAAEAARLSALFGEAGLPHLFLKGTALGLLAYGDLAPKHARDIDLLVAPEDMAAASALLGREGYERLLPAPELDDAALARWVAAYKEVVWRHPAHGAIVELHGAPVDNPRLLDGVDVHSPRQEVPIGGGLSLPTLRTDILFAYLCVHGAGHGWSRLKWLADVDALLGDGRHLEGWLREAERLGAGHAAGQALLLCHRLFGRPLPDPLLTELRRSPALRLLERVALRALGGGGGAVELDRRPRDTARIMLSHFLLGGWAYRAAEFRRKLVHPHDRAHIALPRALHWLYPLLLIPGWQVRRAARVRQGKLATVANSSAISQPTTSRPPTRTQT